jgi:hypothetical protein
MVGNSEIIALRRMPASKGYLLPKLIAPDPPVPVGTFIARLMKLACQNRITFRRAVSLTYMTNSLINAIRLQRAEDVRAAKEPGELRIDWTDVPRPERDRVKLANQHPLSDTLHTPVPA